MSLTVHDTPVTVTDLLGAIEQERREARLQPAPLERPQPVVAADPTSLTIVVVGSHPGAGATSVALALAEAVARREPADRRRLVRLVDSVAAESSGLVGAAERELGSDRSGWRIGSRGAIEIHRCPDSAVGSGELLDQVVTEPGSLVVDAGPMTPECLRISALAAARSTLHVVLVCRATVPGVRRAEPALAKLPGHPVVVGLAAGRWPRRWPGTVRATFGPRLTAAYDAGRVALMPADGRLEVNGLDADPLPKAFAAAASQLLDLIAPGAHAAPTYRVKE